ncbi:HEAT repeat domain-containing protein [Patescibacteria group bacterium]|nr:HEAT repeat domain-containing protein [Patescibacteria group bacterium]
MHALYTLDGLDALAAEDLLHALDDSSYGVRLHALRLADPLLDSDEPLLRKVLAMTGDGDASVRLQLAMTLGETGDRRASEALLKLATQHGRQRWMAAAILSSAKENAHALLDANPLMLLGVT